MLYKKGSDLNGRSKPFVHTPSEAKVRKIRCLLCVKIRGISDTSPEKMIVPCSCVGGLLGIECFDAGVAGGKIGIFYCLYVAARQDFFPRTAVSVYK